MRRSIITLPLVALILATPSVAAQDKPAPASQIAKDINIPYEMFTLKNGLRVIVHTDRKAPVVGVSVFYNVGSKHEPRGKTGFAHLFEHLMFEGSENVESFDELAVALGAANNNGSTAQDRTNYVETVPKSALERMLYIESDRMGYLLGAVTQDKLDQQRGVVQNEKRQGDNQPHGMVKYAKIAAMLPPDHPYGHEVIGSMADLDNASLEDVRSWFREHYGPNNAILVLAGDVDVKTAKPMVERWFNAIPRGPKHAPPAAPIITLKQAKSEVLTDNVANVRLNRSWTIPGLNDKDATALEVAASVLGGLASSRLDNALVRREKLAVNVWSFIDSNAQLSTFEIGVDVKPGVDPVIARARLDAIIADLIKNGPTADEVQRVVMRSLSGKLNGLEVVGGFGGKATTLAEGELYSGTPAFYKKQMAELSRITPAQVKAAMDRWLTKPAYDLMVKPGERVPYAEAKGSASPKPAAALTPTKRAAIPNAGAINDLDFPKVQRGRLSNGIELVYAQRKALPITTVTVSFDAGHSADSRTKPGTQRLMLSLLDEGADGMDSIQIAEAQERLGSNIYSSTSMDRTTLNLSAPSANLSPSLGLFSRIALKPDFAPAEVDRLRSKQLSDIANELKNPNGLAGRILPKLVYGEGHPYAIANSGTGTVAAVSGITRDDLVTFHRQWLRPDKAKIFVVSDRPLAEVQAALDAKFGQWKGLGEAGAKLAVSAPPAPQPRIVLVDRPDSPQSLIVAGQVLGLKGTDDLDAFDTANRVLGNGYLSRFNWDLRQTKHWSYGARGVIGRNADAVNYTIFAPVQADKTGPSIASLQQDMTDFFGAKGISAAEHARTIDGVIREMPGNYEQSGSVLAALQANDIYQRADNHQAKLASKIRRMSRAELDSTIRKAIAPKDFVWVVVGDAKKVRSQLDGLGLPVEEYKESAK